MSPTARTTALDMWSQWQTKKETPTKAPLLSSSISSTSPSSTSPAPLSVTSPKSSPQQIAPPSLYSPSAPSATSSLPKPKTHSHSKSRDESRSSKDDSKIIPLSKDDAAISPKLSNSSAVNLTESGKEKERSKEKEKDKKEKSKSKHKSKHSSKKDDSISPPPLPPPCISDKSLNSPLRSATVAFLRDKVSSSSESEIPKKPSIRLAQAQAIPKVDDETEFEVERESEPQQNFDNLTIDEIIGFFGRNTAQSKSFFDVKKIKNVTDLKEAGEQIWDDLKSKTGMNSGQLNHIYSTLMVPPKWKQVLIPCIEYVKETDKSLPTIGKALCDLATSQFGETENSITCSSAIPSNWPIPFASLVRQCFSNDTTSLPDHRVSILARLERMMGVNEHLALIVSKPQIVESPSEEESAESSEKNEESGNESEDLDIGDLSLSDSDSSSESD